MDDHLTYKIGEVCVDQFQKIWSNLFAEAIENVAKAFEQLSKSVAEAIGSCIAEMVKVFQDYFNNNKNKYEYKQEKKQLRAIKAIKPTHKVPVYKIIPKVRSRC